MKKKKIAIFLPSLSDGGAEKVMVSLANNFVSKFYSVDLLLVSQQGVYFNMLSDEVRLINIDKSRAIYAVPRVLKYLRNERPDVLLSALTHTNVIALICKVLCLRKIRVVVSERSIISNSTLLSGNRLYLINKYILKLLYPLADSIIAISKGCAKDLVKTLEISNKKIVVINNPLIKDSNININDSNEDKINLSLQHNNKHKHLIIAVGRLKKVKNFPLLIKAFDIVRKTVPSSLIILGEGPERNNLEKLIKELHLEKSIFLPGFVNNPLDYMKKSEVFVSSSSWEGFGNVIVEAMSVGLKIVSVDCPGGPREILEDGKWGKLVPLNNVSSLADAIKKIIDEDVKYDVKLRASHFNINDIADKYLQTFNI